MISSIKQAKELVVAEKNKVVSATRTVIGSRPLLAVLAMLTVGFGAHAIYAPDRLPPISGLSLAKVGLPTTLDFGMAGQQAQQAHDAAIRQGAPSHVTDFLNAHHDQFPLYNQIGFGVCALLLALNLLAAAGKWKGATGVTIGTP